MTLKISSTKVEIQRADGVKKFDSDNKLVYQKFAQSETVTLSNQTIKRPFYTLLPNEFLVLNVKINSCDGNVQGNSGFVGKYMPANGSILIDVYGRASGNSGICDIEYIGIAASGSSLVFNSLRFDYLGNMSKGIKTTNLTYFARVYGYL